MRDALMTAETVVRPERGQVWTEVDPRQQRYIYVHKVGNAEATIQRVEPAAPGFWKAPSGPIRLAAIKRFNGKRGGYARVF